LIPGAPLSSRGVGSTLAWGGGVGTAEVFGIGGVVGEIGAGRARVLNFSAPSGGCAAGAGIVRAKRAKRGRETAAECKVESRKSGSVRDRWTLGGGQERWSTRVCARIR
jgi:hypothetical protein